MSLTTLKPLLADAKVHNYAIGAFNVVNMETVRGVIQAAEELRSPVILQLAEVHLPHAPLAYMAPLMLTAAKAANVPVAVHFDHGASFASVAAAIKQGFSSVMFDGASQPLAENIRLTQEIVQLGKAFGVSVEAELGQVGGAESGNSQVDAHLTQVAEACRFARTTKVDALAVSIGNLHGRYIETPKLRFDRLKELCACTDIPLVLHGGSGISPADFRTCITNGIHKINIGTALLLASVNKVQSCCAADSQPGFFLIQEQSIAAIAATVKEHMHIFQSNGKAAAVRS